ncbi:MAG: hypothetical protein US97_C0007G0013 [Microgenomates group bacterium GW2011_GWF1_38_5]|nr:MAG: hypothetical protein US97_C0007G0013 [Microgenomates group bacterium GW2011_GWF1_38_5]
MSGFVFGGLIDIDAYDLLCFAEWVRLQYPYLWRDFDRIRRGVA